MAESTVLESEAAVMSAVVESMAVTVPVAGTESVLGSVAVTVPVAGTESVLGSVAVTVPVAGTESVLGSAAVLRSVIEITAGIEEAVTVPSSRRLVMVSLTKSLRSSWDRLSASELMSELFLGDCASELTADVLPKIALSPRALAGTCARTSSIRSQANYRT